MNDLNDYEQEVQQLRTTITQLKQERKTYHVQVIQEFKTIEEQLLTTKKTADEMHSTLCATIALLLQERAELTQRLQQQTIPEQAVKGHQQALQELSHFVMDFVQDLAADFQEGDRKALQELVVYQSWLNTLAFLQERLISTPASPTMPLEVKN